MGSVKDLKVITPATDDSSGIGLFTFSDRYSVFDWGEMPDLIRNKGAALCLIGAFFFETLEKHKVGTHYLGLMEDGKPKKLAELAQPSNSMLVRLLNVIKPTVTGNMYNYAAYHEGMKNYLIPLEIIYRNYLPEGSSVFKRLKNGSLKLDDIGLKEKPSAGMKLFSPIFDVSTKLESTDRYVDWKEARLISGLTTGQMEELKEKLLFINNMVTDHVSKLAIVNEDGKFEFGMDENKKMILVDVVGTPDECRFTYDGIPVSKEVARVWYRKSEWYGSIEESKKKEPIEWNKLVTQRPYPLPTRMVELISYLYLSFCNELTGRKWFNTPPLRDILPELDAFIH